MLRGGLQVVTQRNANCKPNSPRGLWSSQLFRAFVRICDSLSLFYVSLLVLITVKGLRVATVFISNQWLSRTRPYIDLHICILSSEMTSRTIGVEALWVVQMEIFLKNKMTFSLGPSSKNPLSILWLFSAQSFSLVQPRRAKVRFNYINKI